LAGAEEGGEIFPKEAAAILDSFLTLPLVLKYLNPFFWKFKKMSGKRKWEKRKCSAQTKFCGFIRCIEFTAMFISYYGSVS
jgi:hypothetical protein